MSFFTREKLDLALFRTKSQFDEAKNYAFRYPVKTSAMIASLFVLSVYFPATTVLALCVGLLALIGLNLVKEPDFDDATRTAFAVFHGAR